MSVPVPPVETGPGADLSLASSLSRKCTNCGRTGHNSRTCLESREAPTGSLGAKTASEVSNFVAEQHRQPAEKRKEEEEVGAASDQESAGNNQRERKKGIAWTEEEHRLFLLGLQKLGKGDWRGISRHYVQSRSPTQVASHAQKYFIRQSVAGKRKRRSSLFDLVPEAHQQEGEVSSIRAQPAQAVKKESRAAAPLQMESPHIPMPGIMQGAEAFALAYWYQAMMAQQNPMAWIQAMYPQGTQGQMTPPPSMTPFMASGQGLVPPPMMQQPGFPFMSACPPYTAGQPPNMAAQGHALANAYMAQQQQIAAAIAMGVMPFPPEAMAAAGAALQQNPTIGAADEAKTLHMSGVERPEESMPLAQKSRTDRQQQQLQQRSLSSEQESRSPHDGQPGFPTSIKQEQAYSDAQQQQSGCELANERNLGYSHLRADPPPESFGHGALVRPQAYKACPAQSYGELPSYMLGSQETSSRLGSTSADSQSTGLRVSTYRPSSGFGSTPEFSESTNGGFTGSSGGALTGLAARLAADAAGGGHDEGSKTRASKSSKQARADNLPAATST